MKVTTFEGVSSLDREVDLDYGRIYDAVTGGLGVFEDYARAVLQYLKTKP